MVLVCFLPSGWQFSFMLSFVLVYLVSQMDQLIADFKIYSQCSLYIIYYVIEKMVNFPSFQLMCISRYL